MKKETNFLNKESQIPSYFAETSGSPIVKLEKISNKLQEFSGSGSFVELPIGEQTTIQEVLTQIQELQNDIKPTKSNTYKLIELSNSSLFWTITGIILSALAFIVTIFQIILFFVNPH